MRVLSSDNFRCVLDSCGCDMGGDCECLCTSFAEYAQVCNAHGIAIRWRSQELCRKPIIDYFQSISMSFHLIVYFFPVALQCNEECSTYSPCMSTCPTVTCDNPTGSSSLCAADACVEGISTRRGLSNDGFEFLCIFFNQFFYCFLFVCFYRMPTERVS